MRNTHHNSTLGSFDLVGIPYTEKDCWGIVSEFYRLHFNIELSNLDYHNPLDTVEIDGVVQKEKPKYKEIHNPKFGDIILLRVYGLPVHVGIYLDNRSFLHTLKNTGSIIDNLSRWKSRTIGYYRWQKSE